MCLQSCSGLKQRLQQLAECDFLLQFLLHSPDISKSTENAQLANLLWLAVVSGGATLAFAAIKKKPKVYWRCGECSLDMLVIVSSACPCRISAICALPHVGLQSRSSSKRVHTYSYYGIRPLVRMVFWDLLPKGPFPNKNGLWDLNPQLP